MIWGYHYFRKHPYRSLSIFCSSGLFNHQLSMTITCNKKTQVFASFRGSKWPMDLWWDSAAASVWLSLLDPPETSNDSWGTWKLLPWKMIIHVHFLGAKGLFSGRMCQFWMDRFAIKKCQRHRQGTQKQFLETKNIKKQHRMACYRCILQHRQGWETSEVLLVGKCGAVQGSTYKRGGFCGRFKCGGREMKQAMMNDYFLY